MSDKCKIQDAIATIQKEVGNMGGERHLVVLTRGFIFIGNLKDCGDGERIINNAGNVRKWEHGGFGGLTCGGKSSGATVDSSGPIKYHRSAEVLCAPISEDWENE